MRGEPSKDTSIKLPLEESDRLAHSTRCLVPSRRGEPFNLVTSVELGQSSGAIPQPIDGHPIRSSIDR